MTGLFKQTILQEISFEVLIKSSGMLECSRATVCGILCLLESPAQKNPGIKCMSCFYLGQYRPLLVLNCTGQVAEII